MRSVFEQLLADGLIEKTREGDSSTSYKLVSRKVEEIMDMPQPAYVEVDNGIRFDLNENDLKDIGAFTRQNVERWLIGGYNLRPSYIEILNMMPGPIKDFHAVCGDIDIPWAKEESKSIK